MSVEEIEIIIFRACFWSGCGAYARTGSLWRLPINESLLACDGLHVATSPQRLTRASESLARARVWSAFGGSTGATGGCGAWRRCLRVLSRDLSLLDRVLKLDASQRFIVDALLVDVEAESGSRASLSCFARTSKRSLPTRSGCNSLRFGPRCIASAGICQNDRGRRHRPRSARSRTLSAPTTHSSPGCTGDRRARLPPSFFTPASAIAQESMTRCDRARNRRSEQVRFREPWHSYKAPAIPPVEISS